MVHTVMRMMVSLGMSMRWGERCVYRGRWLLFCLVCIQTVAIRMLWFLHSQPEVDLVYYGGRVDQVVWLLSESGFMMVEWIRCLM